MTATGTRTSLDVVERHMLLQFAYQVSECGQWLVVAGVDQVGSATDVKVWVLGENDEDEDPRHLKEMVGNVWTFVVDFAKKADVEWRIIIAKRGVMDSAELQG